MMNNGGEVLKKWLLIPLLLFLCACSDKSFESIPDDTSFIAAINILQPSAQFFNDQGEVIANWQFEEAYTGGVLIDHNRLLMYGNQLSQAVIYDLVSGKKVATIDTPVGTTYSYYDEFSKSIFIANSKTNEVYSYDETGMLKGQVTVRNYPMSMIANEGLLYVVNYKDTLLSVIDMTTLQVVEEWPIPSSSHGLWIDQEKNELWLGGHGEGTTANESISIFNITSGEKVRELDVPMMPIQIDADDKQQAVISHGSSTLYIIEDGTIVMHKKVGANPFAVSFFQGQVVVAGYDDNALYFLKDGEIVQSVSTNEGPFQLLTREGIR